MVTLVLKSIIEARNSAGISQKYMADSMGISRKKYAKIESGRIFLPELLQICNILNLHVQIIPPCYMSNTTQLITIHKIPK